jgi:opacity protein-like surface antigen
MLAGQHTARSHMTTALRLPRHFLAAVLIAAALGCVAAAAERAHGYIYWTNLGGFGNGEIGRANLDYTDADRKLIRGGIGPSGIAVSAKHVYWLNVDGDSIGRARLNGRKVDQRFVEGIGFALGIAVADGHVYWTHGRTLDDVAGIGRARTNGQDVQRLFIDFGDSPDFTTPAGIDVANGFIYWANAYPVYTIGRAAVDGSGTDQRFIADPGLNNPFGLDVSDTYIYWSNRGTKDVSRAPLDGSEVELDFLPDIGRISDLAVHKRHIYWPGRRSSLIRSNLAGTRYSTLSAHGFHADSIAVDSRGPG